MKLYEPTLQINFLEVENPTTHEPETIPAWVFDDDIVKNSFSFNEQLLNGLDASSNRVSFKLKRSCTAIPQILNFQVDAKAQLTCKLSPTASTRTTLFTGYLSDNYTWKVNTDGEQELQVTIEDIGTKLLGKAFLTMESPSLYYLEGKVFSGANNILSQICDRAGVTIKAGQMGAHPITTVIQCNVDKNITCKDLMGNILKECGYTYYFDNNGELCLYKIDCTSVDNVPLFDRSNLWVSGNNAITLNKKVRQYKQINVSYDEYEKRNNVLVYKDISGQDTEHPDCNIVLKPGQYYPVNLTDVSTVQDMQQLGTGDVDLGDYVRVTSTDTTYEVVERGTPGADVIGVSYDYVIVSSIEEISFVEAEDIDRGREIISINSVHGTCTSSPTIYSSILQRGSKNISVVLQNNTNQDAAVSKLQATANVVDIKAKGIIVAGESVGVESSENVLSTEAKYIHKQDYVQNYANLLVSYYKYCNYSYTFYARYDDPDLYYTIPELGSIVEVHDDAFSQLDVKILLTGRTYNDSTSVYQFSGVAVQPFNLNADTDNQKTLIPDKVGIPGPQGPAGEGVSDILYKYTTTADQTPAPDPTNESIWSTNPPPLDDTDNRVLWLRTRLVYTDGHTEDEVSIAAIYGDPGGPGETGTTVTMQYALTYENVDPTADDWSDERDTGWYVGYVYWTRYKFTDGEGNVTYSDPYLDNNMNDIMSSLSSFTISSSVPTYEKNLRSKDPIQIVLTAETMKYFAPTFTWTVNGETYTGSSVTFNYRQFQAPDSLNIQCDMVSLVNNVPYNSQRTMVVMGVDKTVYNKNFEIQESDPAGGLLYVEGDSYVKKVTTYSLTSDTTFQSGKEYYVYSQSQQTYVRATVAVGSTVPADTYYEAKNDYYPYVYTDGSWVQITNVAYWPTQIAQVRDVILSKGVDIPETSVAIYGYFKILSAQQAQIDTVSSSEIILQEGGVIRSQNYRQDTEGNPIQGFRIDSQGNSAFVKSNVVDSIVSGSFTSNPLETQDRTPGDYPIIGYLDDSADYYNDGDAFDYIVTKYGQNNLEAVDGHYGPPGNLMAFDYVLAQDSEHQKATQILAENNNIMDSAQISGTMPIPCSNVKISAVPLIKKYDAVGYRNIVSTAVTQYSYDGSTWNDFDGSVTVSRQAGQSIYARQVYTPITDVYTQWTDHWYTGSFDNEYVYAVTGTDYTYSGDGYYFAVGGDNSRNGHIWKSEDGESWTRVTSINASNYLTGIACGTTNTYPGESYKILVVGAGGVYRHDTHWSQRQSTSYGAKVAYGDGVFRIFTPSNSGTMSPYYDTKDGDTITEKGQSRGWWCYGNGRWVQGPHNGKVYYYDNQFIELVQYDTYTLQIYVSQDGVTWGMIYSEDFWNNPYHGVPSIEDFTYNNGYYFMGYIPYRPSGSNQAYRVLYSTDLVTWEEAFPEIQTSSNLYNGVGLASRRDVGVAVVGSTISKFSPAISSSGDMGTLMQTGSLQITYDYSYYPVGANLMNSSKVVQATISDSHTKWSTNRLTIRTPSYQQTPYWKFKEFRRNGVVLPTFDARQYNTDSTFRVMFQSYSGGDIEGSALDIASASQGMYFYNVKWNGAIFQVFLDGVSQGSFSIDDYFRDVIVNITPVETEDAILTKTILPKSDVGQEIPGVYTSYSVGNSERKFTEGWFDTIHGVHIGAVQGNLEGDTEGTHTGSVDATGSGARIDGPTYGTHTGPVVGNADTSTRWSQGINLRIVNITGTGDYVGEETPNVNAGPDTWSYDLKLPKKIKGAVWN